MAKRRKRRHNAPRPRRHFKRSHRRRNFASFPTGPDANPKTRKRTKSGAFRKKPRRLFRLRIRRAKKKGGRRAYSFLPARRSNPFGGMIRIPTLPEVGAVLAGGVVLPMAFIKINDLSFMPSVLKAGWGNIAFELVLGTVASGLTRKYLSPNMGDVLFYVVLARAVARGVSQAMPSVVPASTTQQWADPTVSWAGVSGEDSPETR